jgi:uncharacterized membrane protein
LVINVNLTGPATWGIKYLCPKKIKMKRPLHYKKLLQYLLQGLLVLAPLAITGYAIYWVISSIDSWIPIFRHVDENGQVHVRNYGIGFILIIAVVMIIGYFSSFFITSRAASLFNRLMDKIPGIKHIYGTSKDFFEAFAGDKKKFTHNVLACVDGNDVWRVGFVTQEDMTDFGMADYIAVYIPMAYSVAGNVYIIPKGRVKPIENISASQTMKFAVSGGVTSIVEEEGSADEIK